MHKHGLLGIKLSEFHARNSNGKFSLFIITALAEAHSPCFEQLILTA